MLMVVHLQLLPRLMTWCIISSESKFEAKLSDLAHFESSWSPERHDSWISCVAEVIVNILWNLSSQWQWYYSLNNSS